LSQNKNKDEALGKTQHEALKRAQQLRADYRATFSTASGIRVLEDLSRRCFVRTTTFKDFDTNAMLNREGKRSVFLHIQTMMEKKK
jgi:hypothetical protein